MYDISSEPFCKFERHATGSLWFGNEKAVPYPFTKLETHSVEDVVSDPCYENIEHKAKDIGRNDDVPVRMAQSIKVEDKMRHDAVDGKKLHQVETVRYFADPYEDTPRRKPLHSVRDLDPSRQKKE